MGNHKWESMYHHIDNYFKCLYCGREDWTGDDLWDPNQSCPCNQDQEIWDLIQFVSGPIEDEEEPGFEEQLKYELNRIHNDRNYLEWAFDTEEQIGTSATAAQWWEQWVELEEREAMVRETLDACKRARAWCNMVIRYWHALDGTKNLSYHEMLQWERDYHGKVQDHTWTLFQGSRDLDYPF